MRSFGFRSAKNSEIRRSFASAAAPLRAEVRVTAEVRVLGLYSTAKTI
jgi:hypothetical protein